MSPIPAFVPSSSSFHGTSLRQRPALSARRPSKAVSAVLDTPPSANPYLQKHSGAIIRDYLTRRAVRTVLYYFMELGDYPSRKWLLNFESFDKIEREDKFRDGDAFLKKMFNAKPYSGFIVQQHPRGYYSRKFPFSISPRRIGDSILASRMQLAAEWEQDLRCVEAYNLEIQRMSFEKMFESDERRLEAKRSLIFDFDAFSSNQTPLRYKNFKSLLVLVTQHAVARLQPFLRDTSNHDYMYMMQFVSSYGPLKDGDAFVKVLMEEPKQCRTNPEFVIDPRALAMHVMDLRKIIANEWISVMKRVPEEQLSMKRSMLEHAVELSYAPGEDVPNKSSSSGKESNNNNINKTPEDEDDFGITGS